MKIKNLIILLSLSFPLVGLSNSLPAWYEANPDNIGKVYNIDQTSIVIGDMLYEFSPLVKVSTLTKKDASLNDIKIGSYVSLKFRYTDRDLIVDHIYQMPIIDENRQ